MCYMKIKKSNNAFGYFYTRLQNPTNDTVAAKICELEGGAAAMLTSSVTAVAVPLSPRRGRLRGRLICTPFYIDFHICNSCFYIDTVILIFAVQNPSYFT